MKGLPPVLIVRMAKRITYGPFQPCIAFPDLGVPVRNGLKNSLCGYETGAIGML